MKIRLPFVALALVSLLLAACSEKKPEPPEVPAPILEGGRMHFPAGHPQLSMLKLSDATPSQVVMLDLSAKVVWNEDCTQRIYPAMAGRVERIAADVGQDVRPGALLGELASPDFGQAQADAAGARADQALARKQLQRQRELLEAGIVARRDFEQAEADAARAEAELTRANSRIKMYGGEASVNQRLALRARVAGVVVERNINPGQELRPDQSGPGVPPLFVISDPSSLWVQIDARESEVAALRPGTSFELELPAWPGRRFPGQITAMADVIDPATRTIKVRGLVQNPERLIKAEMLATAHIQRRVEAGVTVPSSAVLLRGEKHWVFLSPEPGVFELREIQVGVKGPNESIVTAGLAAGEKVVFENNLLLARQFKQARGDVKTVANAPEAVGEAKRP